MFHFFRFWLGSLSRCFHSGQNLLLENLALRQQLAVLKRRHPRPKLSPLDKLFWVLARRFWSAWKQALLVVTPETVVRWHRAGFRMYWSLISRVRERVGRKKLSKEVRDLIYQMVAENPTLGAPRIHGELLMLGFDVSERTISRWMKQAPRDPDPARRWLSFLRNHREAIAAMDFFTVPTVTFSLIYCFFVIGHDRRRILHLNVTRHPTSTWIVHQLREAFPYQSPLPGSLSLIVTQNMGWKFRKPFNPCTSQLCKLPSKVLGRTELRNAGWAAAGVNCSTKSL
jgi:putative transposase